VRAMHGCLVLTLVGCGPATAVLLRTAPPPDSTGATDSARPVGPDAGLDPGSDPADPGTPLVWEGRRDVVFQQITGACEDTLTETGEDVTDDPLWSDVLGACPGCDKLFWVQVDRETLCAAPAVGFGGYPVDQQVIRGVEDTGGGAFVLWNLGQTSPGQWERRELARGTRDGNALRYAYDGQVWGVDYAVSGRALLR